MPAARQRSMRRPRSGSSAIERSRSRNASLECLNRHVFINARPIRIRSSKSFCVVAVSGFLEQRANRFVVAERGEKREGSAATRAFARAGAAFPIAPVAIRYSHVARSTVKPASMSISAATGRE